MDWKTFIRCQLGLIKALTMTDALMTCPYCRKQLEKHEFIEVYIEDEMIDSYFFCSNCNKRTDIVRR